MIIGYQRDTVGRTNKVTYKANAAATPVTVVNNATYLPFGPLNFIKFGNFRTLTKTYDLNYGIDSISASAAGGLTLDFSLDVLGNIKDARPTVGGAATQKYQYDNLYRLKEVDDGTNALLEGYTYSRTGDRLSKAKAGQTTQAYAYNFATGGHRVQSIAGTTRNYDPNGNTTSEPSASYPRVYDETNRLRQVTLNGPGSQIAYIYDTNGRGERVGKTGEVAQTLTLYDEAGNRLVDDDWQLSCGTSSGLVDDTPLTRLAGSTNALCTGGNPPSATAAGRSEYIYLDGLPVALARYVGSSSTATLSYIETDHLGTPRQVIDPARNVAIWKWDFFGSAFGEQAANEDPDADGISFRFNLRYPGQYFDSETGLNYNYFRDYEPSTGRYVESDPIGLRGGISTYGYVRGNPLGLMDMLGLCDDEESGGKKKCRPGVPGHMTITGKQYAYIYEDRPPGTVVVFLKLLDECNNPIEKPGYWIQEHLNKHVEQSNEDDWSEMNEYGVRKDFHAPPRVWPSNDTITIDQWFSVKDPAGERFDLPTMMRTYFVFVNHRLVVHTDITTP